VDNSLSAFASNPRYALDGLESEVEREELETAQKADAATAINTGIDEIKPSSEMIPGEMKQEPEQEMHTKVLNTIESISRGPRDVAGGLYKAFENTLDFVAGKENIDQSNEWFAENFPGIANLGSGAEQSLQPEGTLSGLTQDMVQFLAPFSAYMKGMGALSAATSVKTGVFTNAMVADIATSATALDPHMERFSTMVKEMGIDNKIVGWLADNENETDSEGRLKNIIENGGLSIAVAVPLVTAAMTMKGLYRASKVTVKKSKKPKVKESVKETVKPTEKKVAEPKSDVVKVEKTKELENKMDDVIKELKAL
jgi:hypothetical protein